MTVGSCVEERPPRRCRTGLALVLMAAGGTCAGTDFIHVDDFEQPVDCSAELTCPAQPPDKSCIAGRIVKVESDAPLRAPLRTGSTCGAGAMGGACELNVEAYDALRYYSSNGTPLEFTERVVDGCGRYRFSGLTPPSTGSVFIATDDGLPVPEPEVYVMAANGRSLAAGASVEGFVTYVVRSDVDAAWTTSAGNPITLGGASFAQYGAFLMRFRIGGVPAVGVTAYANNNFLADRDFYFSDSEATSRTTISEAQATTGTNGSVLVMRGPANTNFIPYTGFGGAPAGCTWPELYLAAIPNRFQVLDFDCPAP